jgi:hypothetical protein
MSLLVSVMQKFSPTIWEKHGLASHTLMLLQVSKEMLEAVCEVGRETLPAHVYAKPSQIREVLYWNRLMYNMLDLTRVMLTVQFMPETDMDGYLATSRSAIEVLQYIPNSIKIDLSQLKIIGDDGHEIVIPAWFTGEQDKNYWTGDDTTQFLSQLAKQCVLLEDLQLGIVMRDLLFSSYNQPDAWEWLAALPNLHSLSALNMQIDLEITENLMNVVAKYTKITQLNVDHNNISNLLEILPDSFNLASLSLCGCDLGMEFNEDMSSESAEGVSKLLTEYPSLVYLDLGYNHYLDEQGEAIALALRTNTSLTELDLRNNDIAQAMREQIATVWAPRNTGNLLLDEGPDESDMEDTLDEASDESDMEDESDTEDE